MARSARIRNLKKQQSKAARTQSEELRQEKRRKPRQCTQCDLQARRGSNLCRNCLETLPNKREFIFTQGCPGIQRESSNLCWEKEFPRLASWIMTHFNYKTSKPLRHTLSKCVQVLGWNGEFDVDRPNSIEGIDIL
jgi:hypothetical protein